MIRLENISIKYDRVLLDNTSIVIYPKKITVIQGESGCGKTSLLYQIGLLKKNSALKYRYGDTIIDLMNDSLTATYRKTKIGFVFQDYCLLDHLSIYENMCIYAEMCGRILTKFEAKKYLEMVSLDKDIAQEVTTLSGGEKQRLAIACAIAKKPELLILDEPTNALDEDNMMMVMSILRRLADQGMMILMTSHDDEVVKKCDVVYKIKDQKLYTSSNEESDINTSSLENIKLSFKFYLSYCLNFIKANKIMFTSLFLILGFCISCLVGYIEIGEAFENKHLQNLNNIASREILVTSQKDKNDQAKYNRNLSEMDDLLVQKISSHKYCEAYYPFYLGIADTVYINNEVWGYGYAVQPYTSYNHYEDYIEISSKQEGVYLSSAIIDNKDLDIESIELCFDLMLPSGEIKKFENVPIAGILKNNVISYYTDNDFIIYMPYDWMPELSKTQALLVYANQYNTIDLFVKDIQELDANLGVFNEVAKISNLESSMEIIKELSPFLMVMMMIVSGCLITMIYTKYISNRRLEICLLKVNGLNKRELLLLLLVEQLIQTFIVTCIAVIMIIVLYSIVQQWIDISISLNIYKSYISALLTSFVYTFIPTVCAGYIYLFDDPANILRKD